MAVPPRRPPLDTRPVRMRGAAGLT